MKKYIKIKHEQTIVADYEYRGNRARIRIYEVNPPWSGGDSLLFHLLPAKKNGKPLSFRLRPDEAIIISKLLLEAVYKTTTAYTYTPTKKQKSPHPTL